MSTFATLKSDIANWMRRSDLTSVIPSFVALAESDIFSTHIPPLRVRQMETETTLTVTALTATVPSDYVQSRYIKLDDAAQTTLQYTAPENFNRYKSGYFTVVGTEIRLPEGITSNVKLVYYAKPAALANDSDTNSVLTSYYGVYLATSLKYAAAYIKDVPASENFRMQSDAFIVGANDNNKSVAIGPLSVKAA